MNTEFWFGNVLQNGHFEERKRDVRVTLRYILGRQVVRM